MPIKPDIELFKRDQAALEAYLASWAGANMGDEEPDVAPDPVNMPMIRHWLDAFQDRNPVYESKERAEASRFGGLIAPPAMMQTWIMPRPNLVGIAERGGAGQEMREDIPIVVLHEVGFTGALATNSVLEFYRPLRHGEHLKTRTIYKEASALKTTSLGEGYFNTWNSHFYSENEEEVGCQTFTMFKFKVAGM